MSDVPRKGHAPAAFIPPMAARLVARLPEGDDWLMVHLRHAAFLGLRHDKKAKDVRRED